jgi:zinc protease
MIAAINRLTIFGLAAMIGLAGITVASAQGLTLPPAEHVVLENGVVLILNEKHDVPMIGFEAVSRGGAIADPVGKSGLAALFAALIQKGAGDRSAAEFAGAIDAIGGRLAAAAELEDIVISGEFMARDVDLMIELLADMLQRPTLSSDELDKLRERSINRILAAKDSDPGRLISIYGEAFLYPAHPYGNSVAGSEASLADVRHSDVLDYYEQQLGADRLIIAVSGDFDAQELRAKFSAAFGAWRTAAAPLAVVADPEAAAGGRVLLVDKPGASQTYFWLGAPGVSRSFDGRAGLDLANTLFGGRFTSMLNNALRIESGLTYGARSRLNRHSRPGSLAIVSFTEKSTSIEAIDMALGVLGRLHDDGVDDVMLASARNYVLGQFPTDFETAAQLASEFAMLEAQGLDRRYIDDYGDALSDVTVETIASVIADVYPQRDELVFVVIGDATVIRESLTKYGSVTEMSITEPRFHAR